MKNLPYRLSLLWSIGLMVWMLMPVAFAQSDANQHKIALVMKALSNPFFNNMATGAKEYAGENHLTLEVFGTETETDTEHQISIVNNLVSRNYGAIVIAPMESRKLGPILKKAIDQKIVVINIDNPLDQDVQTQYGLAIPFVGSSNTKGAALVGDYIRRQLRGKGRIVIIEGISGARNGELRKTGFLQAVKAGGGIEVAASVSANWHTEDAFAQMTSLLKQGVGMDAVFCANDQMALGALQALDSHGLSGKVLVAGYDNTDAVRNELRNGRIQATVEQHPELMGRYGVALAQQALRGQRIPASQETPLDLITHESFGKRIALSLSEQANPFFAALLKGAQAQADLHGVEFLHSDADNDDAQQLIAIRNFVEKKVDFLLINPTNSQAVQPAIELANSAGIPVLTVDRKGDGGTVVSHIASDNVAGGRLAAEFLARALQGDAVIAEIEGIPGTSVSYERGKGFNEVIAQHPKLKIAVREVANFNRDEARAIMTGLLAQHQRFDAIFAHNDNMILGVMDALQAASPAHYPILVGFDAIPAARQAVRESKIAATVAQKPAQMGALAVDVALKSLRGEPVPATIAVALELVERGQ